MKNLPKITNSFFSIAICIFFLAGCNLNESKEARIRSLEAEIKQMKVESQELENRVQAIESQRTSQ